MNRPGAEELFDEQPWLATNIYTGQGIEDESHAEAPDTGRERADSFDEFMADKQLKDADKATFLDIKAQREKVQHMQENLQHRFYPFNLDDSVKRDSV